MLVSVRARNALGLLALAGLLAVQALGADPSAAARLGAADGQVSVLRNGEMWALFAGSTVRVGEMIVTGPDGVARLEISDGSFFYVYPNSRVMFRANPGNLRDLLEVLLGKIKVHIQTIGGRPNFYKIHSPTAVISVRGTVFEVAVDAESVTWVAVDEGLVIVEHRLLPGKAVPLAPGQSLQVFPNAALAAAGINKMGVAARAAEIARDTLYVLQRLGGRPSGGGPAGGGTPADRPAPPPPPADREAPPPPAPPPPGGPP